MLFTDVLEVVREMEREILFDVEAPAHWYEVDYENGQLIVYEVDEYHENGDEWGEMIIKCNQLKIETIDCSIEEYLKFVIRFFKQKIMYIKLEYPERNDCIIKIDIRGDW